MLQKQVTVKNKTGIHARPASIITLLAKKYQSQIDLIYQQTSYSAKKIMEISSANIKGNSQIDIRCQGSDEEEAMSAFVQLFSTCFGED